MTDIFMSQRTKQIISEMLTYS